MIRKLMASTAVLALMSTGALTFAQEKVDQPVVEEQAQTTAPSTETEPTTELAASDEKLMPEEPTFATAFLGKSVYSSEDPESDNIGDINDLIVNKDGSITHAVVGVGGFLGIGEKNVAVPFDELKVVERDGDIRLVYASTREDLEAAQALDRTAFDPAARAAEEQAASAATDADTVAPAPVEPSQDMAAAPAAEPAVDATAPAEEDVAATAPADATTAPAEDLTAAPAEEEVAAAPSPDATTAPASEISFVTFGPDQIYATDLIGKTVYGADNESIGEISDLMLQPDGDTRVAVIDVGGFLGVGEKTVGLPFDQLELYKAEDGSDQVKVAMSKEQLEQLPAMKFDTAAVTDKTAPADPMVEQPAEDMAAAPAAEPAVVKPAETAEAPAADVVTTGSIATEYTLATQDIAANQLIGATVYGPNDESIGEVSEVIFTKTGDIDAVIIDVGGFLGMGEKPVAVQFGALNVRKDENGTMTVRINATQAQLEQAPTFEGPTKTTTVQ